MDGVSDNEVSREELAEILQKADGVIKERTNGTSIFFSIF
jgi:hypothetical protein